MSGRANVEAAQDVDAFMTAENLLHDAQSIADRITALRRAIHAEPELGLETPRTLAKVRAELADLPLDWREARSCTGAVAVLNAGKAGRRVLIRGDMDALPIGEQTGLPFASVHDGRMHACGHDAHTAMLAGAARLLAARAEALKGEVWMMFQPGEEGFHGARVMIEDGLLDPLPDAAFALHVLPNSRNARITSRAGALLASADVIDITIEGVGGHASMPHHARDPVPIACEVVMAMQAMVTRRFDATDAVVLTITEIEAGTAHNVIPETVRLKGTIRTLSPGNREAVAAAATKLAAHVAKAHQCQAVVTITPGFPPTINDPRAVMLAEEVAKSLPAGEYSDLPRPMMGAEDFSYVLEKMPGMMAFLGAAGSGEDLRLCAPVHSGRMTIDESVLPRGSAFLAGCASHFLERGWS